jgi:hypothetical protein
MKSWPYSLQLLATGALVVAVLYALVLFTGLLPLGR